MFDDRSYGREFALGLDTDPAWADVVQPVRLKLQPFDGGSWCIPGINAAIPVCISPTAVVVPSISANFALEAHALGVKLPEREFTSTQDTLNAQFARYAAQQIGDPDKLAMDLAITISANEIKLTLSSGQAINTFAQKPVVEKLNAYAPGLGWFIYQVLNTRIEGLPIYRIEDIADFIDMLWFDCSQTDEEVIRVAREEWCDESIDDDGFFAQFGGRKPSAVLEMVDGQKWLLNRYHHTKSGRATAYGEKPKIMTARAVKKLLSTEMPDDIREIVEAALELQKVQKQKTNQITARDRRLTHELPQATYGASCVLVWDNPDITFEAIEHYETSEMEGGEGDNTDLYLVADASNETERRSLISSFQAIVRRYAAMNKLLKHFPITNGD